jgi:hypothetical protein
MRGRHAHPIVDDAIAQHAQDFAFADTVVATDLDEAIPPSGIVISDETGHSHCVMPVAYPHRISAPRPELPMTARARMAWAQMREGMRASSEELHALWTATASVEQDQHRPIARHNDTLARAATVGRRVRTFFSFFEWDRADVFRAAWLGFFVFVLAATVGAFALQSPASAPTNAPTNAPNVPRGNHVAPR